MNIGKKIKSLRAARRISQEALAEAMGVSFQAVSKWETGASAPDISLLPALACFFGVSTDELLDYDRYANEKKICEICNRAAALRCENPAEAEKILRDGLKRFPGNDVLLNNLLYTLPPERSDEAAALCKTLIETTQDDTVKYDALRILAEIQSERGEKALCAEALEQIPELYFTKLQLMACLLDGDASVNAANKQLWLDFESVFQMLNVLRENLPAQEAQPWRNLGVALLNTILSTRDTGLLSDDFLAYCEEFLETFRQ